MVQKEHSHFSLILCFVLTASVFMGCKNEAGEIATDEPKEIFEAVDVSLIPNDTLLASNKGLTLDNGVYFFNGKPYSGFIKDSYENGFVKSIASYYLGMQHGITKSFYPNGKRKDKRSYKANVGYGRHFGFWENGKMKFDFVYFNDKREGLQKQWYESGQPYAFLTFTNDREDGMQHAWRQNGKAYINYEAKDGHRYGLQKSNLCYTLVDEKIKTNDQ